jgi:hypothetical protein
MSSLSEALQAATAVQTCNLEKKGKTTHKNNRDKGFTLKAIINI